MYLKASHYKYPGDDFFITKKKVKFIWIHFRTVIPKSQSKAFHHIINYLQFWTTTHFKWSVIIYITYQGNIRFKQKEIMKKDSKK